jgi:oligopeptide/dipeptide ABC transporter ATP-binding protein
LLEAQGLTKRFRVRQSWTKRIVVTAVDDVSFQMQAGRTVAVVGESGCGKTTLGKLFLGLLPPDEGVVYFRGRSVPDWVSEEPSGYRRAVQMVFQNPLAAFNPMMTIGATLTDAMRLRKDLGQQEKRLEARQLLNRVGLETDYTRRFPSEMSGGQLQRVGIARALAPNPQVVFLDEPTSALDMSVRGQILNLLLDLQREEGLAYLLVAHDVRAVRAIAHYLLVMYLGQVVEEGPAEEVLSRPLHPYTRGLLAATLVGFRDQVQEIRRLRVSGEVLQLPPGYVGCKLYRRCPLAQDRCQEEPQALQQVDSNHAVRCWRALDNGGAITQ